MPHREQPTLIQNLETPKPRTGLAVVPSWLLSFCIHAALVLALASVLPGLRGGIVGDPDGDFRKIGIYVGQSGDGDGSGNANGSNQGSDQNNANASLSIRKTGVESTPATAPTLEPPAAEVMAPVVPLAEPPAKAMALIIGPGGQSSKSTTTPEIISKSASSPSPNAATDRRSVAGSNDGRGGPRGSLGNAPFFGIWDRGLKYVYVIDCSGSMYGHDAIRAAKNELLSSLRMLARTQQFQIVFYSQQQKWLTAEGKKEFQYFAANDVNRRLAAQFTAEIQPDDGTLHLPALKLALRLHPDVLFFLTDGGDPGLNDDELEEVRRANNGQTRIHCVQFDSGEEAKQTSGGSFVRKLAAQNHGQYTYRDVTQFDRKN